MEIIQYFNSVASPPANTVSGAVQRRHGDGIFPPPHLIGEINPDLMSDLILTDKVKNRLAAGYGDLLTPVVRPPPLALVHEFLDILPLPGIGKIA